MPPKLNPDSKADQKHQPQSGIAASDTSKGASAGLPALPPDVKTAIADDSKNMSAADIAELKQICFQLRNVNAGEKNDDLAAIKDLVGSATVVALGEGTHGTAEFFKMKHRLLEYLVVEMGFTIFAIEANMPECQRINEYVLGGSGNLEELIKGVHLIWNTQELFDMIEWMRRYNLTAKTKLQFTGFDMQNRVLAERIIEKNLLRADLKLDSFNSKIVAELKKQNAELQVALAEYYQVEKELYAVKADIKKAKTKGEAPSKELEQKKSEADEKLQEAKQKKSETCIQLIKSITSLQEEMNKCQKYLETALGVVEYQWILQNVKLLEHATKNLIEPHGYRDKAMADNVRWILEQNSNAKIAVWAHSGHMYKRRCLHEDVTWDPMGYYLAAYLKENYRAIGFATYGGGYTAVNSGTRVLQRDWVLHVPPKNSLEDSLKKVGHSISLVNLQTTNVAESQCLKGKIKLRFVSATQEDLDSFVFHNLQESFDGIIYIEKTTASQAIKVSQTPKLAAKDHKQPPQSITKSSGGSAGEPALPPILSDDAKMMDAKEIAELKQICSPLMSFNAGEENADLFAMKAIIGDATVVGLGESTHGTAEFFKMKHRLLEYFVVEMGFTIFAIEANMPECQRVNEYVLGGKGNPKELIEKIACPPWHTQEVHDMVEWMRHYNLTAKTKLQFTGFDMQAPRISCYEDIIKRNLTRADFKSDTINLHAVIAEIKKAIADMYRPSLQKLEQDKFEAYKKLIQNINLLQTELKKHQIYLESKLGVKEYQWTLQNATLLKQSVEYQDLYFQLCDFPNTIRLPDSKDPNYKSCLNEANIAYLKKQKAYMSYRDKAMAANVAWIQKQNPNSNIVLCAHNGHISKQDGSACPYGMMGTHLTHRLGDHYRAIGFVTYGGTYTAPARSKEKTLRRDLILSVPQEGSLEDSLKKVGHPIMLVNLHTTNVAEPKCFKGNVALKHIGWSEESVGTSYTIQENLRASYDAVIYIENTTASQPIEYPQPTYHNLRLEWSLFKKMEDENLKQRMNDVDHKPYGSAAIEFRNSAGDFKIDKEVFRVIVRRNLAIINDMGNNSKVTALYNAVKNRQYGKAVILLEEGKGIIDVTIKCTDKLQTVEELLLAQGTKVARGVLQKMRELNPPRQNTTAVVPTAKLH